MLCNKFSPILFIGLASHALAEPQFSPVSVPPHQYLGDWEHYVGGGVAVFDCNGNNLPDVYAAGGTAPAMLLENTSNDNMLSFADRTPESLAITGVTGAYPIKIDGDEWTDLVIIRVGENMLLRGLGNCEFTPFQDIGFSSRDAWTTAFSATWEGENSLPTLAFGNYVDRTNPEGPFGTCDQNELYRPKDGKYGAPVALSPGYCALSMLFSDWARNGQADLRVSNDRHYYVRGGSEQMWEMAPNPRLYTEEDGWQTYSIWGMGIASRDLTGDGFSEVYLTSMGDQKLQRATGDSTPRYEDYTYERGTTAHRPYTGEDGRPSTGWHVAFGDVTNNGLDDIFVAKGNVERMAGAAMQDPNNLLIQDSDGNFSEQGDVAGIATFDRSRGAALVDLNNNGLLDLVVNNRRADIEIYQNTSLETGHWLGVRLSQSAPNADAIGAYIEMKSAQGTQTREITIGGGHAGGDLGIAHFGLGENALAEIRVIWPDGEKSQWKEIQANKSWILDRQEGLKPL